MAFSRHVRSVCEDGSNKSKPKHFITRTLTFYFLLAHVQGLFGGLLDKYSYKRYTIVFNSNPSDTVTFLSYVDFASGLAKTYPDSNFSLLTYKEHDDSFSVNFEETIGRNISSDMWWSRGLDHSTGELADRNLTDSNVLISLDADLSGKVPMCTDSSSHGDRSFKYKSFDKQCYQVFTRSFATFEDYENECTKIGDTTEIKASQTDDTIVMTLKSSTYFCNTTHFNHNFKNIYEDFDRIFTFILNKCRYGLCEIVHWWGDSTTNEYAVGHFYAEENKNYKWVEIMLLGGPGFTWYEARSYCSDLALSLLTFENVYNLNALSRPLQYLYERLYLGEIPIQLSRSRVKIGRRFVYRDNKDLMLASWRDGEPKGSSWKDCVVMLMSTDGSLLDLTHSGWSTVGCGERLFNMFACHSTPLIRQQRLVFYPEPKLTSENLASLDNIEKYYSVKHDITVAVSVSFKLAKWSTESALGNSQQTSWNSGIHETNQWEGEDETGTWFWEDKTDIWVDDLGPASYQTEKLVHSEIRPFFHKCKVDDDKAVKVAIPVVYVCDGKADCRSGSDESSCGLYGVAACAPNEWMCTSRQCVPLDARCDMIKDCQDGSDEKDCDLMCRHKQCGSGRCLPKPWFNDGQEDCEDGSDESDEFSPRESCVFLCNRTQCVTRSMLNDSVVDCKGPEGPIDETLGALESIQCTKPNGHQLVNNWAPRCVLARDMFGEIIGCRYFQHLAGCEDFTCPAGYVKCPKSFCIPLSFLNDGEEDCYEGQDEMVRSLSIVDAMVFLCQLTGKQSVSLSSVCDGRKDCNGGEDELECGIRCLPGFVCLAGAVSAIRYNKSVPLVDLSFVDDRVRYLDLSGVDVNNFFKIFPPHHLTHLLTLKLSGCNISSILIKSDVFHISSDDLSCDNERDIRDFRTVQSVDLSNNQLTALPQCSYLRLMLGLRDLNLSHNYHLSEIARFSLRGYFEITNLDLSFTAIKSMDKDVFQDLISLKYLNLKRSKLSMIDFRLPARVEYFNVEGMNIKHVWGDTMIHVSSIKEINSSTFKLCCPQALGQQIHRYVCHFPAGLRLSCNDLIEETFLRLFLWLVILAIIGGNTTTLVYRMVWETQLLRKPYGLFVTNLGVSDLLMGVYLLLIGVADAKYKSQYVLHDFIWRNSYTCWAAGTLATLSTLTSSLFLVLITVERFLAVRYPFGEIKFSTKMITVAVISVWLFGMCFTSLPLLPFAQHWIIYSNDGVCLGLPLESGRLPGWQYSASLFIGLNLILFISIGFGQAAIFKTIREKGKRIKRKANKNSQLMANQRAQEFAIAKQLSVVVLTDFVCLFPVITMGLMTLCGHDVGHGAYRWTAIIVVPINSALNPLLYTLPTIKEKWLKYKDTRKEAKRTAAGEAQRLKAVKDGSLTGVFTRKQKIQAVVCVLKRLRTLRQTLKARVERELINREGIEKLNGRVTAILAKKILG